VIAAARRRSAPLLAAIVVLWAAPAGRAWGYDFALSVRTVGQGYQERRYGPSGAAELLSRRRLTQYLNLSLYNIEPDRWRGPGGDRNGLSFEMALRFDSDFGRFTIDRPRGPDTIAELPQNQIDILYAYLAGRDVGGRVDFQLGRQVHYDLVDFYAFDGADVAVRAGRYLALQAFGGTEVRGQLPLSAPLYELDGTSPGSRDPATRPQQAEALRPLVGGALALDRGLPVRARLAYRRAFSATVDPRPGDPDLATNQEVASLVAEGGFGGRFFLMGGVRYNLLVGAWDDAQTSLRVKLGRRHLLSAEHAYLAPTFDGDSIWNVFGAGAFRDFRAGYDVDLTDALRAHARGFVRQFVDPPGSTAEDRVLGAAAPGGRYAAGGNVGAGARGDRGRARADLYFEEGYGGRKIGGDVHGRFAVAPGELDIEGRLTVYGWRAQGAPEPKDALMAGVQLGALYQMSSKIRLHTLLEDNTGTSYRAQLRALLMLEVDAAL
jgi:hypothetical protein